MTIRTIIVDDEPNAVNGLTNYLNAFCEDVEVIGDATSVVSGLAMIVKEKPDLVFLDLKLVDGLGFEILDAIEVITFQVVIMTGMDHYAIQSINNYRKCLCHYLLKPYEIKELIEAVDQVRQELKSKGHGVPNAFKVPDKLGFVYVQKKDIIHCDAQGAWTNIFLSSQTLPIVYSYNLKTLEPHLLEEGSDFFRIHKSHIINRKYVKRYLNRDNGRVIMSNDKELPIARNRKKPFLEWLEKGL